MIRKIHNRVIDPDFSSLNAAINKCAQSDQMKRDVGLPFSASWTQKKNFFGTVL